MKDPVGAFCTHVAVHIEGRAGGPAMAGEDGWQLPCDILGRCDGKLIDQADGTLTFVDATGAP